jgi:hypothetical protein
MLSVEVDDVGIVGWIRGKELGALIQFEVVHAELHRADQVVFQVIKVDRLVDYYKDVGCPSLRVIISESTADNGAAFHIWERGVEWGDVDILGCLVDNEGMFPETTSVGM